MTVDLSKLQADETRAIALLQSLPTLKAQVADLQAKLAAQPHDDPTVQTTVDQMAAALEAALPAQDSDASGAAQSTQTDASGAASQAAGSAATAQPSGDASTAPAASAAPVSEGTTADQQPAAPQAG